MSASDFFNVDVWNVSITCLRVVVGVTVAVGAALALSLAARRASAAVRHRICSLAVLAALVLPAFTILLPQWRMGWVVANQAAASDAAGDPRDKAPRSVPHLAAAQFDAAATEIDLPTADKFDHADASSTATVAHRPIGDVRLIAPATGTSALLRRPPAGHTQVVEPLIASLPLLLSAIWLSGALAGFAHLVRSIHQAWRLTAHATLVDDSSTVKLLKRLCERMSARCLPAVLESATVTSPLCLGIRRARIILPQKWRNWPEDYLRAALAHELAHIRRADVAWQLVAKVACILYWFHPLVWLAAWRMRVERETACDDCVLAVHERPSRYARLLLELAAEMAGRADSVGSFAVAMASRAPVERRIRDLLRRDVCREGVGRRRSWALAGAMAALVVLGAVVSPLTAGRDAGQGEAQATESTAGEESAAETEPTSRITGTVAGTDGTPLADIRVEALISGPDTTPEVVTDADGQFEIELPRESADGVLLRAVDRGERNLIVHQVPYARSGIVREAEAHLVLQPAREMAVTVVDQDGKPIANANVGASILYQKVAAVTSDEAGKATLRVPQGEPLQNVWAVKRGVGLDYFAFFRADEAKSDPYRLQQGHSEPLTFVLNGTRTVTVRAIDADANKPIAKAKVYAWYVTKPDKGDDFNLSGIGTFSAVTDANGRASFDFIPADEQGPITFWVLAEGYFSPDRHRFDIDSPENEVVASLLPMVPLKGRVLQVDGSPAAGAEVLVSGDGHGFDGYRGSTTTTDSGEFEINVYPEQYYSIVAEADRFVSPLKNLVVLKETPSEPTELTLAPVTRVFGRLVAGPEETPLVEQFLQLYQQEAVSYYDLPEQERIPNPTGSSSAIVPRITRNTYTDQEGRFEFLAGPGSYYITGPDNLKAPYFAIVDEPSFEMNLSVPGPDRIATKGRVVLQSDPQQGIAEARIVSAALRSGMRRIDATSDENGRFEAERGSSDMLVYAKSKDGQLAGIVKVLAQDEQVTIPIGPIASVTGRLVHAETGEPIADQIVEYGVFIQYDDSTFNWRFGSEFTTDKNGNFAADGLVPGQEYTLEAVVSQKVRSNRRIDRLWRTAGTIQVERSGIVDVGDIRVDAPQTLTERIEQRFVGDATLFDERLAQRLRDAEQAHQRVLLVLGEPQSRNVRRLFTWLYQVDDDDVRHALADYLMVEINAADAMTPEESEALDRLGVPPLAIGGLTFVVLDEAGDAIAHATADDLSVDELIDSEKLVDFLRAHRRAVPDAEDLLLEAINRARLEDKRVLLQHSGAYCRPCILLSRYLDEHQELIEKDYVYVQIDARFENGEEVIERYRGSALGGLPWMAILDTGGRPLITSSGPQNIGFPSTEAGIAHFAEMLRTTARRLTDDDIETLIAALRVYGH